MISYTPLMRTLSKNNMSIASLAEKLGITKESILSTLSSKQYFRVQTLLRIAEVLEVGVADLIEWKEGEGVTDTCMHLSVDWERLETLCNENKISFYQVSRKLEHGPSFMSQAKSRKSDLHIKDVTKICELLNVEKETFVK